MKLHTMAAMFLIFFLLIFGVGMFNTYFTTHYEKQNRQEGVMLINACNNAMRMADVSKVNVWEDLNTRNKAVRTFFETYEVFKGRDISKTDEFVPFILFVDTNGFYLYHEAAFNNYSIMLNAQTTNAWTGLNTWAETKGSCTVRYYLDGSVDIYDASGNKHSGYYADISHFRLWPNKDAFDKSRIDCIVNTMERKLNNYMNSQTSVKSSKSGYTVVLPATDDAERGRLLANPTIISFIQGIQSDVISESLNVFAIAGMERIYTGLYYADSNYYYDEDEVNGYVINTEEFGTQKDITTSGRIDR